MTIETKNKKLLDVYITALDINTDFIIKGNTTILAKDNKYILTDSVNKFIITNENGYLDDVILITLECKHIIYYIKFDLVDNTNIYKNTFSYITFKDGQKLYQ
jgi:hypothetical protein